MSIHVHFFTILFLTNTNPKPVFCVAVRYYYYHRVHLSMVCGDYEEKKFGSVGRCVSCALLVLAILTIRIIIVTISMMIMMTSCKNVAINLHNDYHSDQFFYLLN